MKTAGQLIQELTKPGFSFELLPPMKGNSIKYTVQSTSLGVQSLFINITSHREEAVYRNTENGLFERRVIRKGPVPWQLRLQFNISMGLR